MHAWFVGLVLVVFSVPAFAGSVEEVKIFVQDVADSTLAVIQKDIDSAEKEKELEAIFVDAVDTDWLARFAMGRYYRQLTDEQKTTYRDMYKRYMLLSYVPKFREYSGESFHLLGVTPIDNTHFVAKTELALPGQAVKARVDYKVHEKKAGGYKINDIVAEGVSLATTQRSDFGGLLSRKGIDVFLEKMSQKIERLRSKQ